MMATQFPSPWTWLRNAAIGFGIVGFNAAAATVLVALEGDFKLVQSGVKQTFLLGLAGAAGG